jgi:hypothetical protein
MTTSAASDERRIHASEKLFAWSRKNDSRLPMLAAFLITSAAFAFMLHSLRVDLGSQAPTRADHAALIIAGSDSIGIELKRRAREEGPFPLRFDPAGDEAVVKLQQAALDAIRFSPPPYAPTLRPLRETSTIATPSLAPAGEAVFPRRLLPAIETPLKSESHPQAMLTPISGISAAEMPRALPEFSVEISGKSLRDSWRFMIHVDANGRVLDCIALNGGESPATSALTEWLRQVEFQPGTHAAARWFAIDLGIINQAPHAPDPH